MAVTNKLNLWTSDVNKYQSGVTEFYSSNDFGFVTDKEKGFKKDNPISSKNFNTVLRELTLCNLGLFNTLATLNPSATITLGTESTVSDIASFVATALSNIASATNIKGGATGAIPYQTATDVTGFINAGTDGYLLQAKGSASPVWINPSTLEVASALTADSANEADNISGGSAGELLYQSAIHTTSKLAAGTVGQILKSNGAAAPSWVNQSALTVGEANNISNPNSYENAIVVTSSNGESTSFIQAPSGTADYKLKSVYNAGPAQQQPQWVKDPFIQVTFDDAVSIENQISSSEYYEAKFNLESFGFQRADLSKCVITVELYNGGSVLTGQLSFANLKAISVYNPQGNWTVLGDTYKQFKLGTEVLWIGLTDGTTVHSSPVIGNYLTIISSGNNSFPISITIK